MNRLKLLSLSLVLIFGIAIMAPPTMAKAATETEIEDAIAAGVAWLVSQQNTDGSWGSSYYDGPSYTGFVLIKLQDRAYELGYESPFDPAYAYSANVVAGWGYVFSYICKQTLSVQNHGGSLDDPDTNGNGYGIYFSKLGAHPTYTTGIVLLALEASGTPNRLNDGAHDFDGDGIDTFMEITQDGADWLAWAQGDSGYAEGGWYYSYLNNAGHSADNSNGGYATLGLAAAEGFGCTIPDWVKTELSIWIDALQDPVNGDTNDGGSWYQAYTWSWVNQLKTGNLIFEMTFAGDEPSTTRFQNAMDYIERHWHDLGYQSIYDPSWGYGMAHSHYQAMFCLMKGFEYSEIEFIDHDGDGTTDHDWYEEFAQVLVDQQYGAGYWYEGGGSWGNSILDTIWALLTLERVIPNHPPVADAGPDQTVEQTTHAGAEVTLDGSGSSDPDDDPLTYLWTYGSWSSDLVNPTLTLPLGTHAITLEVSDGTLTDTDTVDITVQDTTPPVMEISEEQLVLWPPNHKYHTITIADFVISVTDNCDATVGIDDIVITKVTSDEPEDVKGNGDGKTVDDIVIVDSQTVDLRAERQGRGNGRVYTIYFEVTDASGNTATGLVTVWVPHDQGAGSTAVDDGASAGYTVTP